MCFYKKTAQKKCKYGQNCQVDTLAQTETRMFLALTDVKKKFAIQ